MVKKAIIEIFLVDECLGRKNNEIANEIFSEISEDRSLIPWCKQVDKVVVVDSEKLYWLSKRARVNFAISSFDRAISAM